MKLRVKFKKYGPVRFIGHLDVMRFFQKVIRRAEIDVKYSSGFSPHQIMTFAAPLGVGLTSNGEYMDIEVNSITSCKDVQDLLNQNSVPGIEIISVKVLPDNAGNAMASVAAARYTVKFREGRFPQTNLQKVIDIFNEKPEVIYTKETKKGVREFDLKQGVYELSYKDNTLYMLLDASSAGNIKPIQVIEALLSFGNETLMENALLITREEVYTNIGSEGNRNLVSLDDIGSIM